MFSTLIKSRSRISLPAELILSSECASGSTLFTWNGVSIDWSHVITLIGQTRDAMMNDATKNGNVLLLV